MTFDAGTRRAISHELTEAIQKIAEKYGFDAKLKGGTYSDVSYSPKVEFFNVEKKVEQSTSMAGLFGLPSDIIGKKFVNKTKTFTVSGINLKRPKNCVELTDQNGKGFKCSAEQLKAMMKL